MHAQEITISIAGIPIRFTLTHKRLAQRILHRYAGFRDEAALPQVRFTCRCRRRPFQKKEQVVVLQHNSRETRVRRRDFLAYWDHACGCVELMESVYSFDAFIRVLYAHLLTRAGGYLLHAGGVVVEETAILFPGPSGTGKTTLTQLCSSLPVLNDEIVAVTRSSSGPFFAWGTPFWGEMQTGPALNGPFSIAAFCYPRKDNRTTAVPLSPQAATGSFLQSVCTFANDTASFQHILDTVPRLLTSQNHLALSFTKKSSPAEILAALQECIPAKFTDMTRNHCQEHHTFR